MSEIITNAVDFLSKGGIVMLFIFLCSIAAIVLVIERCITLHADNKQTTQLTKPLLEALDNAHIERAYSLIDSHPCALASIASTALKHQGHSRESIQEAMTDEARQQDARLNRFIPMIGSIASISPLLGLLGTVTGMIQVFSRLADEYDAGSIANPGMLAGGIWEALLTTAAGLCVAIPVFLFHRLLSSKLDARMLQLESVSAQILDIIAPAPKAEITSDTERSSQSA